MSETNKKINICYLRIFATVCVVWLHTCSTLTGNSEMFSLSNMQYVFFSIAHHIMNWAVPVFLMITGALLLGQELTVKKCLTKYVRRMLLALFLFGIPFAAIKIIVETKNISVGTFF